jgi:iron complex outermembrane receptor protein
MKKRNGVILSLVAFVTTTNMLNADTIVNLDDITVTATKTERKVTDVPASINIINQKDIENSVALSASELLKNTAGISLKHNIGLMSSSSTNLIHMRGFGGTSARSLLLLDGVPLNDAYSGTVEWNQIPINSIQRIEVVKGSGSSIYGSNAMGGVINIITKNPKEQQTDIELSYGSMNTRIGSISTTGKVDRFGYFLSGQVARSDGYKADTEDNKKDNSIKRGIERENANMKFSYDIDDSSDISASYLYYNNQYVGILDIPTGYDPYGQTTHTFQVNYSKYFENSSNMKITAYTKSGEDSYDSLVSSTPVQDQIAYSNEASANDFGTTIQYSYPLDDHVITAGFDYKNSYADNENTYPTGKTKFTEGSQDYYGIFAQDEWFVNDRFILNLGGRVDYYKNHSGEVHDEVNNFDRIHSNETFTSFSPKIGAVYHASKDTSVRGSIGKAFRAPTLRDLYGDYVSYGRVYAGNANLDPETVISYEIGVDQKIGKGNLNVALYRSDAKDFIYSIEPTDPSSTNYKEKINVGEVEIKGIEVEADYPLTDMWKVFANYTYNKSKIKKFKENSALEGKYLTYAPKNKASVSIEYINPNFINITATGRYESKRYKDDMNTESKAYAGYTLYDLMLTKRITKNIQLQVSVNDLFDTGFEEYYQSPGRVVLTKLKMSF